MDLKDYITIIASTIAAITGVYNAYMAFAKSRSASISVRLLKSGRSFVMRVRNDGNHCATSVTATCNDSRCINLHTANNTLVIPTLAHGTFFDHPVSLYDNDRTTATLLISWKDGRRKIANTEMTLSLTVIDTVD